MYEFKNLEISIFDVHTTLPMGILDPSECYQDTYKLMGNAEEYNDFYDKEKPVSSDNFLFNGFPISHLKSSHFWEPYVNSTKIKDYYKLQIPIVGKFKKDVLGIKMNYEGIKITPELKIYLSPLGWSTLILIRLEGKINHNPLLDIMIKLIENGFQDGSKDLPFWIENETNTVKRSNVFIYAKDKMFLDIYSKNLKKIGMKTPRYFLMSVYHYEGTKKKFNNMAPGEKALMLRSLYGKPISAEDALYKYTGILNTTLSETDPGFAISDFNHGTFLFPQEKALANNVKKIGCLTNNIREFLIMTLTLLNFYSLSNEIGEDKVKELRNLARVNLCRIKKFYNNKFCQHFLCNHGTIKYLVCEVDKVANCDRCNLSSSCEFKSDRKSFRVSSMPSRSRTSDSI